MRRLAPYEFEQPWLLLCEGASDKRFLDGLMMARGVGEDFYVQYPGHDVDGRAGRSRFGHFLNTAVSTSESFEQNVRAVLIMSDNDDDPANSFREVQGQIRAADGFSVPDAEKVVAKAASLPDIVILMIPFGEMGNLETLCLPAAYSKWPIEPQLDAYVSATPAKDWSIGKKSKTRMQAMLAATCETKPDISFTHHWLEPEEFRVPLDHECFNDLVDFLDDFEAYLGAA